MNNVPVTDVQKWHAEQFVPWQQAMAAAEDEAAKFGETVRRHAAEVKHMAALMLEGRMPEAVRLWNHIGLAPMLSDMALDEGSDTLVLVTVQGEHISLALTSVLSEMDVLLRG